MALWTVFFVSNFVGKTEFAALNLIWPFAMVVGAVGFMFGVGGTALVSKVMGEGDRQKANGLFSFIVYSTIVVSCILAAVGLAFVRPVAELMGAEGEMLEHAVVYGSIIMGFVPTFILQCAFQPFMVAAEKPRLGLWMTVAAGVTNMVLDWLLIGVLGGGLASAAAASVFSQVVGAAWPIIYFSLPNNSLLHLGKPHMDFRALGKACTNGLSELVVNVALSFISMVYNWQLLRMSGEDGVAAYGVIMYVCMLFLAVFFGFGMGVSPVVSFHYGAGDRAELRNLRRRSIKLQFAASVVLTSAAVLSAPWVAELFAGYDEQLYALTLRAFRLYSLSFLLSHFNIFASSFFTALNDGVTSAVISFSRMILFQIPALFALPLFMGLDGIWLAMPVAELCCFAVSIFFYLKYSKKFGY